MGIEIALRGHDNIHVAADRGAGNRQAGGHRLHQGHGEAFPQGGEDEDVRCPEQLRDIPAVAQEAHRGFQAVIPDKGLMAFQQLAVAGEEIAIALRGQGLHGPEDRDMMLFIIQVADGEEEGFLRPDAQLPAFGFPVHPAGGEAGCIHPDPMDSEDFFRVAPRLRPAVILIIDGDQDVRQAGHRLFQGIEEEPVLFRGALEEMKAVGRIDHAGDLLLPGREAGQHRRHRRMAMDEGELLLRHEAGQLPPGREVRPGQGAAGKIHLVQHGAAGHEALVRVRGLLIRIRAKVTGAMDLIAPGLEQADIADLEGVQEGRHRGHDQGFFLRGALGCFAHAHKKHR